MARQKQEKATAAPAAEVEAPVEAKPDGRSLFDLIVKAAKSAKVGEVLPHKGGAYARIKADGRTVAYIVKGKTMVNVYPQALAESMPADLQFRTVALGSHHYGRGEVVVPVDGEPAIENAVAALKAAKSLPPVPKKEREKAAA